MTRLGYEAPASLSDRTPASSGAQARAARAASLTAELPLPDARRSTKGCSWRPSRETGAAHAVRRGGTPGVRRSCARRGHASKLRRQRQTPGCRAAPRPPAIEKDAVDGLTSFRDVDRGRWRPVCIARRRPGRWRRQPASLPTRELQVPARWRTRFRRSSRPARPPDPAPLAGRHRRTKQPYRWRIDQTSTSSK